MSGYGHLTLEERGRLRGMMERLKPRQPIRTAVPSQARVGHGGPIPIASGNYPNSMALRE